MSKRPKGSYTCPECKGTGKGGNCGWCGGRGKAHSINTGEDVDCPRCKGTGKSDSTCHWCNGYGYIEE